MEYLGQCPKCKHHLILKTIKKIPHIPTQRLPQRLTTCDNCRTVDPKSGRTTQGATVRATIIGTIEKPVGALNEFDPECGTTDTLKIQLWK